MSSNKKINTHDTINSPQASPSDVTGTTVGDKRLLDVSVKELVGNITGSFTPSGLTIEGKHQLVSVPDSDWVEIPTPALANRNQINIQNNSTGEIKINHGAVKPTVGYQGMTVIADSERLYQITDSIKLWARAESGAGTLIIDVEELA